MKTLRFRQDRLLLGSVVLSLPTEFPRTPPTDARATSDERYRDGTIPDCLREVSPGCLVRSTLLVVAVLRSAETRTAMGQVAERAGHKLVQTSSSEQARILLSNGVEPDLVVFETPSSGSIYDLREMFRAAAPCAFCVISGREEQRLRDAAAELGVTCFLDRPLIEEEILKVLEGARAAELQLGAPSDGRSDEGIASPRAFSCCAFVDCGALLSPCR